VPGWACLSASSSWAWPFFHSGASHARRRQDQRQGLSGNIRREGSGRRHFAPPEYVIESYLVVLQMAREQDTNKLQVLVEKSKKPAQGLQRPGTHSGTKTLTDPSCARQCSMTPTNPLWPFMRFETTRSFPPSWPAIRAKADGIISGPLVAAYETHRKALDQVVAQGQCTPDRRAESADGSRAAASLIGLHRHGRPWVLAASILMAWLARRQTRSARDWRRIRNLDSTSASIGEKFPPRSWLSAAICSPAARPTRRRASGVKFPHVIRTLVRTRQRGSIPKNRPEQ